MKTTALLALVLLAFQASSVAQGQALELNSIPEYLAVAGTPDLVPANGLTVEAWVYFDPNTGLNPDTPTIVRKNPADFAESYNLRRRFGTLQFIVRSTVGEANVWTGAVSNSSWHHVAGTYDGAQIRTYIDGVLAGSTPLTGAILSPPAEMRIGAGNGTGGENWQGLIDEVRIWSVARTQAEIQASMNVPIFNAVNLIAAWHFEGDLVDSAGAHALTVLGSPGFAPSSVASVPWVDAPPVAGLGQTMDFTLYGLDPFYPYVFELSVTGTGPGQAIGDGRYFPLNPPNLFLEYGTVFPGVFNGFFGFMDVNGRAFPQALLPSEPGLIGYRFDSAFVILDATASMNIKAISLPSATVIGGPAPQLASISPNVAPIAGGTTITITGANFAPGAVVTFGTAPSPSVAFVNANTLTCVAPAGSLSTVTVKVTNPDGSQGSLANALTYTPNLLITTILPTNSIIAGAPITVFGNGFIAGATLSVGGQPINPTTMTMTQIVYPNPSNIGCAVPVVVSSPTGETATRIHNPDPSVTTVFPSTVSSVGGSTVNLIGANLTGGTVTVDGVSATMIQQSSSLLRFVAPPHAPGAAVVIVTSPIGCDTVVSLNYQ